MNLACRIGLFVLLTPIAFGAAALAIYISGMGAFTHPVGKLEPYIWGSIGFACFIPVLFSLIKPSRNILIVAMFSLGFPVVGASLMLAYAGITLIPMFGWYYWAFRQLRNGEA